MVVLVWKSGPHTLVVMEDICSVQYVVYTKICTSGFVSSFNINMNVCFYRESAKMIPLKIQRGLFIFAVSNSCMNPIVYGKQM